MAEGTGTCLTVCQKRKRYLEFSDESEDEYFEDSGEECVPSKDVESSGDKIFREVRFCMFYCFSGIFLHKLCYNIFKMCCGYKIMY
jgi:hypothetical protein